MPLRCALSQPLTGLFSQGDGNDRIRSRFGVQHEGKCLGQEEYEKCVVGFSLCPLDSKSVPALLFIGHDST